jgi:type 1 glutamine amidotransferase
VDDSIILLFVILERRSHDLATLNLKKYFSIAHRLVAGPQWTPAEISFVSFVCFVVRSTPKGKIKMLIRFIHLLLLVAGIATWMSTSVWAQESSATKAKQPSSPASKLNILLVAGGCCHDYPTQTKLLKEGIEQRIDAEVTVVLNLSTSTETTFEIYNSDDWAEGYDVVIHDECSSSVTDQPYVDRILNAHRNGTPAVNLHCAMHSYRWGNFREPVEASASNAAWYEMIGVQSIAHGPQAPIEIVYSSLNHPITRGLEPWTTINEELYNNIRVFDATTPLATGNQRIEPSEKQLRDNPNSQSKVASAVVVWANEYGPKKTKVFSTSLGHNNQTVADPRYLDLVVRGIQWTTGSLANQD